MERVTQSSDSVHIANDAAGAMLDAGLVGPMQTPDMSLDHDSSGAGVSEGVFDAHNAGKIYTMGEVDASDCAFSMGDR